ncbi:MAG: hypothetical protein MJ110_01490 [Lachnospiraceae bacterium]|nr:hypothetical protein [Lachnospiraceae bacterium]
MKISDYSVNMTGKSVLKKTSVESIRVSMWGKNGGLKLDETQKDSSPQKLKNADLFDDNEGSLKNFYEKEVNKPSSITDRISMKDETLERLRFKFVDHFLKWLYGKDYKNHDAYELLHGRQASKQEFGGEMYYSSFFSESEETTFQSKGTVIDSEGREISFDMSFTMSRSFTAMTQMNRSFGSKLIDPLVINLDTPITDIGNQSFYFDLNCDGEEEEITNLGKGSAFLALDKNEDGTINDGSELFGALSGDGFADLATYDEDGNNWIDENDSIFDKLKIFSVDPKGVKTLLTLKEAGVGAICLSNTGTEFHFTGSTSDNANAFLRKTGMFLYENGKAGTIQQVDLAVI